MTKQNSVIILPFYKNVYFYKYPLPDKLDNKGEI